MKSNHIILKMKQTIREIQESGISSIPCNNLIAWLDHFESPISETTEYNIERYKAELTSWNCSYQCQHESNLEMFRSVIVSGQNAIRSSFLLNGSAGVTLLAFIGHLAQFASSKVPVFAKCIFPFAVGVLLTALNSGATYLSQWLYAQNGPKSRKWGYIINISCMVLGLCSYVSFIWGLFTTYKTFINYR